MCAGSGLPLKIPAVRSRGRVGNPSLSVCACTPSPLPLVPWHGAQPCAKSWTARSRSAAVYGGAGGGSMTPLGSLPVSPPPPAGAATNGSAAKAFTKWTSPQRVLSGRWAHDGIAEISLSAPNRHHFLSDLSPFGLDNPGEVFYAADRPYGLIEASVVREGVPSPAAAWEGIAGFC